MAKKSTPIITHTEILCLAIQSVSRKLHEYDEMVDRCDNMIAREMLAPMRDANAEIWEPKLAALKELYKIETGKDFS
jgi:hypothetical protein